VEENVKPHVEEMFLTVKPYLPKENDYDPEMLLIPEEYQKTIEDCCEMKVKDR